MTVISLHLVVDFRRILSRVVRNVTGEERKGELRQTGCDWSKGTVRIIETNSGRIIGWLNEELNQHTS
jgi:hypothetical protein